MADVKTLKTRIALKYDSYSAWTSSPGKDLVLLKGEIGICEIPSGNTAATTAPTTLFKVGDGEHTFENLQWSSALAADVYDWAKAETVVLDGTSIKFKTGETVKHTIDLSSFATDAEVEAIRSSLDSRIVALENKFTGTGSVQGQIDAIDARLDIIEGVDTVDGSVKKALKDAKAYADSQDSALKTELQKYADQAETDAKSYADTELAKDRSRLTAAETAINTINGEDTVDGSIKKALKDAKAYADQAELDAIASAKTYTDGRETAIKDAYEKYADDAEQAAKDYADDEIEKAVEAQAAIDLAQNTEIGNKLDKSVYDAYITGKSMSDEELKAYADSKASAAQSAAETNAATTAQSKVDALANGQVATNAAEIARVAGLVSSEATARENADKALDERLVEVEAFFKTTEGKTLDTALDTLVEIQDYLNGEGDATGGLISRVAANEEAIGNLEDRVDDAEGAIEELKAADTTIGQRIDALVGTNGTIATGDATTLASAKSYTDGRETLIRSELKTAYETYADKAEEDAIKTANAYTDAEVDKLEAADLAIDNKVKALQDVVDGYSTKGSIKIAIEAAASAASVADGKAVAADGKAGDAQTRVGVLENKVNNETTGLAATKVIADRADAKSLDNANRIKAIEDDYLKMADLFIIDCGTSTTVIHEKPKA